MGARRRRDRLLLRPSWPPRSSAWRSSAALGYSKQDQIPLWLEYVLEIPLWAFLIGVPIVASRRKGNGPVRDLGLRMRWVDVPIGIGAGLVGQLLLVPLVYWPIFKIIGHNENVSKVAEQLTNKVHGPADTVLIFLLVAIGAPFAEELFFRGLTQRSLLKLRGDSPHAGCGSWPGPTPGPRSWSRRCSSPPPTSSRSSSPDCSPSDWCSASSPGASGRLGPSIWAHLTFNALAAAALVWKL